MPKQVTIIFNVLIFKSQKLKQKRTVLMLLHECYTLKIAPHRNEKRKAYSLLFVYFTLKIYYLYAEIKQKKYNSMLLRK